MRAILLFREERGRMIAEKQNQIQRMDERSYKVASQSGDGVYDVIQRENGSWICNCLDHIHRKVVCKHIWAVEFRLRIREKVKET